MNWLWFALISAFFITIETILEKKVLKKEHSLHFSTTLAIIVTIISLIFLPYLDFNNINIKNLILLYLVSWITTISFLLITKSIRHMEISTVAPFLALRPFFILISSLLFLKESSTKLQFFGIILVVFGTYVLESKKHDYLAPIKEIIRSKYIHYVFIALVISGFGATFDRYFLKNIDLMSYFFLMNLFIAFNYAILSMFDKEGLRNINELTKVNWIVILIAFSLIISRISLLKAFSLESAFLVEPVKMISVILIVIFGGTMLHERFLFKKIIASLLILGGIYLIII